MDDSTRPSGVPYHEEELLGSVLQHDTDSDCSLICLPVTAQLPAASDIGIGQMENIRENSSFEKCSASLSDILFVLIP